MRKNLRYFLAMFSLVFQVIVLGQGKIVTGNVTDERGTPLPGVSVVIPGTSRGTITDVNGNYSIIFEEGQNVLQFSFIGFKKEIIKVQDQSVINVQMEPDIKDLDEVVVIGYGTMRKSDLTGAVVNLSGEKLRESILINPDQMMQGKVAGIQVQTDSGAPGASTSIRIRGASSINNTNEPLYIIDGIPVSGEGTETAGFDWSGGSNGQDLVNPLASIAPSDIVSIDVLKDASATAIYGDCQKLVV
jgi:hypothetical protein